MKYLQVIYFISADRAEMSLGPLCASDKSTGDDESILTLKPIGSRVIQSPKQRVPVAPQNEPQLNKNF